MNHSRAYVTTEFNRRPPNARLLPIMGAVFSAFTVIGFAMPVLPLHVHQDLGFGVFVVGLVAGSQFGAAILSRIWAGRHADARGPKVAVVTGLGISTAAGLIYLVSLQFLTRPVLSVAILLLGRAVLGVGESFIITGAQAWGIAIAAITVTPYQFPNSIPQTTVSFRIVRQRGFRPPANFQT